MMTTLAFRPVNDISQINQSLFERFSSDRRHFLSMGLIMIPSAVMTPRLTGGIAAEWAISSYDVGYGISYASVTRLAICVNGYYYMCLCVSQDFAPIDPSLELILPDSRIPYDRLIPRSAGRYRC